MSEATVRASIKTLIESVTDVGKVYNREPLLATWDAYLDFFRVHINGFEQVRGFTITCEEIARLGMVTTGVRDTGNQAHYTYRVRGYNSLNYERDTENVFLTLVIAVMAALDGGIVTGDVFNAELAQLDVYEPRVFGDVLCHYAEITQIVMEIL